MYVVREFALDTVLSPSKALATLEVIRVLVNTVGFLLKANVTIGLGEATILDEPLEPVPKVDRVESEHPAFVELRDVNALVVDELGRVMPSPDKHEGPERDSCDGHKEGQNDGNPAVANDDGFHVSRPRTMNSSIARLARASGMSGGRPNSTTRAYTPRLQIESSGGSEVCKI